MAEDHPTGTSRYELQQPEIQRLRTLSEEVRTRLHDIAALAASTVGINVTDNALIRFLPREATLADSGDWVEIIDVDGHEVCYGVIDGVPFAESPCGAAMSS